MKLNLQKYFFTDDDKTLVKHGEFKIKAFRCESGVEALKIKNKKCSFIFTPFKGQQVWHFTVDGEEISMQTEVKEPQNTMTYLENYGGFLYHCGIISFGAPDATHPHHGEIPNSIYDKAYLECGEDEGGKYIVLGGELEHNTAFVRHYKFKPDLKLYEDSSVFRINVTIENLRSYPLEWSYLCHINFRPYEGAELVASTRYDHEHIKLYRCEGSAELQAYFDKLEKDFTIMNTVNRAEQVYDPEICFGVRYESDENGRAYTLQDTGKGACYVCHPADILTNGVRWISRTNNEDAMGMVLPATGEHLGYENAKAKGQLQTLEADGKISFSIEAGYIDADEVKSVREKIDSILNK